MTEVCCCRQRAPSLQLPESLHRISSGGCGSHKLDQGAAETVWTDQHLLLSQICGQPLTCDKSHAGLEPIASPRYHLPEQPSVSGPTYQGLVVVHEDSWYRNILDLAGARLAINDPGSYSGCIGLQAAVWRALSTAADYPAHTEEDCVFRPVPKGGAPERQAQCTRWVNFFASGVLVTGSHRESAGAVGRGEADVACVDCVTFNLLRDIGCEAVARLRVIGATPLAPSPPFVVPVGLEDSLKQALHAALCAAIEETLNQADGTHPLRLVGVEHVDIEEYREFFHGVRAEASHVRIDTTALPAHCRFGELSPEGVALAGERALFYDHLDHCGYACSLAVGEQVTDHRGELQQWIDRGPDACCTMASWALILACHGTYTSLVLVTCICHAGMLLLWGFNHHEATCCFQASLNPSHADLSLPTPGVCSPGSAALPLCGPHEACFGLLGRDAQPGP